MRARKSDSLLVTYDNADRRGDLAGIAIARMTNDGQTHVLRVAHGPEAVRLYNLLIHGDNAFQREILGVMVPREDDDDKR